MQPARPHDATRVLLLLAAVMSTMHLTAASYLTGSGFPFEGCKIGESVNIWTARLSSYVESERDGSTACFEFGFKPQEQCREAADRQRLRCCNSDLVLNKFKMYVDPICVESRPLKLITVNGAKTSAFYPGFLNDDDDKPYIKITNLNLSAENTPGTTLCISLKGTREGGMCPTLSALANNKTRDQGVLEFGLYDRKVVYECCPMFIVPTAGPEALRPPSPQAAHSDTPSAPAAAPPSTATVPSRTSPVPPSPRPISSPPPPRQSPPPGSSPGQLGSDDSGDAEGGDGSGGGVVPRGKERAAKRALRRAKREARKARRAAKQAAQHSR